MYGPARVAFLLPTLALAGCPSPASPSDAAVDSAPDAACTEVVRVHSLYPGPLYVRVGGSAAVRLRLARDRSACAADFALVSDDPAVITTPASARVEIRSGSAGFVVSGIAPGRTRLRASQSSPADPGAMASADIEVVVLAPEVPACPVATPLTSGRLTAGARVSGLAGSPLEPASVALPAAATSVPAADVTLGCAPDQVPEGYIALGPAVTFGPVTGRFPREIPFSVPVNAALVPSMHELHAELSYTAPGFTRARIVPLADTRFTPDGRGLAFWGTRLGTYQAVLRSDLGTRRVRRRYTWRAILGISMGAVGASTIGTRHPELFDTIAPLGGAADTGFSSDYLRQWVFGGFCTAAERAVMGDAACGASSTARTPPTRDLGFAVQDFEHFYAPPGRGTGGTFDRRARFQGFRDISRMFGNLLTHPDPGNGFLPLGVPPDETSRTDAERCASPVVLGGGATGPRYYDDEFNPDGAFPVITFCDGGRSASGVGEWDGTRGDYPVEIALAVDLNRNGVRDRGEPVVRNFSEPYRDVGGDGLASAAEPGYDARTNPDPAGDDYDRQYNPGGLEGNFLRDAGEPFEDVGLDGVRCPAAGACPYDFGEGNGVFDTPAGPSQGSERNPRARFASLDPAEAHRLSVWADGGIRDALQFGVNANHFVGAIAQRGESLHVYNSFSSLLTGDAVPAEESAFLPQNVDFEHLPRHSMMRYGRVDASAEQIEAGDGAHVGTGEQIANRILTAAWWIQSRWPHGDRELQSNTTTQDDAGRCANGNFCTFDFRSERSGRTAPVSVYLPPGYHRAQNRGRTYPVVFFLHGYGMQASDLLLSGFLLGTHMSNGALADWQRLSKFIMVFPDGRCREGDGCLEGTFYADAPRGPGRVETYFLDLYDFVSRTYRARAPEDVDVVE